MAKAKSIRQELCFQYAKTIHLRVEKSELSCHNVTVEVPGILF